MYVCMYMCMYSKAYHQSYYRYLYLYTYVYEDADLRAGTSPETRHDRGAQKGGALSSL